MKSICFLVPNFYRQVKGKIAIFLICILAGILPSNKAHATHASGADLQYTWISGKTYKVTVTFYRDCAGVAAPTSISLNARSSTCNKNQNYTLNLVASTGQEITFPCRTVVTKCTNSSSGYAGYQEYKYENNVTLPQLCTDWIFSFYVCCRNCAITSIVNPCNENLYIEATLNNVVAPTNSSPRFTNVPVAFICTNQSFTYNHGVIDPNGDSLVYSFSTPKNYNTSNGAVGNVTFNPGYSATQPLTSSPAVTINSFNGDITMFPTVLGEIGVTSIIVREYRNGVLVGSVIRDMQFLTKNCNPNFLPTATGMNNTAVFDTSLCPGNTISFTVNSTDPNPGDTVTMTWNNAITGATFTSNGARLPQGTFSWTPTAADARSQAYSFIVTVRDNACPTNGSQTYSYSILVPLISASVTSATFNGYNIACRGAGNGTATGFGNGGGLPYTYSWNPSGQTTQTATGLGPGLYTVTIADKHGCTETASVTMTQPPTAVSINVSSTTNVSCNGGGNGSATVAGSGGVGPYTYDWTPGGQTGPTATGLTSNIYTAKVTDQNGCTSQQAIVISQPLIMIPSIGSFQNVSCLGNKNGSVSVTVSGGNPPYSHSWSNGDTTSTISNLPPGTFADTVRDSKGCVQIVSQVITQPGSAVGIPSSSLSTTNVTCHGLTNGTASVSPVGGTLPYIVTWSNGDIGNSADSLANGNYDVHIVDGNGCTFDTTINISQPAVLNSSFTNISIAPSGANIHCKGDTTGRVKVVPTGGNVPYAYSWSNSSTLDSIKNVSAGTYTVLVTDSKGCTTSDTITLTEPTALKDSLIFRNVGCKGESSGGIRAITSGGITPYTYLWSHGPFNTDTVGNLFAGFYQVTITDTNGCVKTDTITINEPSIIVPLIFPSTFIGSVNVACNGDTSGSATLNVFGGTRPFTYQWSVPSVDSFATGLGAGPVSVRVIDANGCSIMRDTVLGQPPPYNYAPVMVKPLCYGDSSGSISLNVSGGVGPYTYSWSNGKTTDSIGHIMKGTYSVIVVDANGCRDTSTFVLNQPDSISDNALVSSFLGFGNRCNGDSSAYIVLHPTGGDSTYTYSWNTLATTDSIGNLSNGTYSVTILDGNGCRKDVSYILSQPPLIVPSLILSTYNGGVNVSCNGYVDGYARASVVGGIPPYSYLWSNGDVADSALGLTSGTHNVLVTDANNCVVLTSFVLTEPTPLSINPALSNFNGFSNACYGDSSACITVGATGGSNPYLYVWEFQDTIVSATLCNLTADTFSVRIIDANGCQLDTSFILNSPPKLSDSTNVSSFNGYEILCNGMSNGSIDVSVLGGVSPFNFAWSTTDTTEDLSNIPAGTYQLIITDANACVDTISYTLDEPPLTTDSMNMTGATCSLNNGSARVYVTGGLSPFTYLWNVVGSTNDSISNIPAGWHSVNITDSLGCTVTDSIFVVAIPVIGLTFSGQIDDVCPGDLNGFIQSNTSGGVPPFVYLWSNGDTTTFADSLPAGYITCQITDNVGCIERDSVLIGGPSLFIPTYNVTNPFCAGINNGIAQITLSGGTPPYQLTWSNGDTGTVADSLGGGYLLVNIIDQIGCTGVDSVNIIQLPAITSSLASVNDVSCFGKNDGSATINPVTGGAPPYVYSWSNGNSGFTANSLGGGITTITVSDVNNCTLVIPVTINEPAALQATTTSQDVSCDEEKDGVAAVSVTGGISTYNYTWSPTGGNDSIASGLGRGLYTVTITDMNNCVLAAVADIGVGDCDLDLPSGFTPNGDGKNDHYVVHGLSRYPENKLTVFNRWGSEVFSKENYTNDEWYGQNNSGNDLPDGTYFVVFIVKGQDIHANSFVELRR